METIKDMSEFQKRLEGFFEILPKKFKDRAVGNIFAKALIPMRNHIRGNVPVSKAKHKRSGKLTRPGNLKRAISIKLMKPGNGYTGYAAKVYIKRGRTASSSADGWYAHFLEFGTADRTNKRKGDGGASRGRIEPIGFFRRGVDSTSGLVQSSAEDAMRKYGEQEIDKAIRQMGLKVTRIKMSAQ